MEGTSCSPDIGLQFSTKTHPPRTLRACDSCRVRKIKGVLRKSSCDQCRAAKLVCTFYAPSLKEGLISGYQENAIEPALQAQLQSRSKPPSFEETVDNATSLFQREPFALPLGLSRTMLLGCIDDFLTVLYSLLPIIRRSKIEEFLDKMHTNLEAYSLILSLCAYAMLVSTSEGDFHSGPSETSPVAPLSERLIKVATIVYRQNTSSELASTTAIATSFLLFRFYERISNHNMAWYYLRQGATWTFCSANSIDDRAAQDACETCLYGLLFISDRVYALQRHRPLTLDIRTEMLTHKIARADHGCGILQLIDLYKPFRTEFISI